MGYLPITHRLIVPSTPTPVQYLLIVLAFAAIYMGIAADSNCGMEISSLLEAYYFSLETMATVGYGVKDEYFEGCRSPAFFITLQVYSSNRIVPRAPPSHTHTTPTHHPS